MCHFPLPLTVLQTAHPAPGGEFRRDPIRHESSHLRVCVCAGEGGVIIIRMDKQSDREMVQFLAELSL